MLSLGVKLASPAGSALAKFSMVAAPELVADRCEDEDSCVDCSAEDGLLNDSDMVALSSTFPRLSMAADSSSRISLSFDSLASTCSVGAEIYVGTSSTLSI